MQPNASAIEIGLVLPCLNIANTPNTTAMNNKMNKTVINFYLFSRLHNVFFVILTTFFFLSNPFMVKLINQLTFLVLSGMHWIFFRLASKQKKAPFFTVLLFLISFSLTIYVQNDDYAYYCYNTYSTKYVVPVV